jgi:hypothetical protein
MTVDLNVGNLLAGIAAVVGVAITGLTALNSRSRLHKVAQQSMELATSLNEQVKALPVDSRARSRAVGLYNELVFQSQYATQRYSQATTPKALNLIDTVAKALFLALLASVTWNLQGIPAEWETGRSLTGLAFLIFSVGIAFRGFRTSRRMAAVQSALATKATDFMEDETPQTRVKWPVLAAAGLSLSAAALVTTAHRKKNQ